MALSTDNRRLLKHNIIFFLVGILLLYVSFQNVNIHEGFMLDVRLAPSPCNKISPDVNSSNMIEYFFSEYYDFFHVYSMAIFYFKGCIFVAFILFLICVCLFFFIRFKKMVKKKYILLCDAIFFLFFSILPMITVFFEWSAFRYLGIWLLVFLIIFRCFQYRLSNILRTGLSNKYATDRTESK